MLPAASHNDHLRLFGQVDKCGHGHRKEKLTVDFRTAIFAATRFGDFDCVREDLAARVFQCRIFLCGNRKGGIRQEPWCRTPGRRDDYVDDGERHIAHRCLLRSPLNSLPRRWRPVDSDHNT